MKSIGSHGVAVEGVELFVVGLDVEVQFVEDRRVRRHRGRRRAEEGREGVVERLREGNQLPSEDK